jgi:hypothetical protein
MPITYANNLKSIKPTSTVYTKKVYKQNSNCIFSSSSKIKLVAAKGNYTKYVPTSFLYNKTLNDLQLPVGKYYVWVYVGNKKNGGCWINNGYWLM